MPRLRYSGRRSPAIRCALPGIGSITDQAHMHMTPRHHHERRKMHACRSQLFHPRKRFVKPTLDELNAYALEIDYNLNAEAFLDYYDANGWKIGGKSPMKNWKAAVRQWKRHDEQRGIDTHARRTNSDTVELTDEESRIIDEIYANGGGWG